jgi:hypothetical protein
LIHTGPALLAGIMLGDEFVGLHSTFIDPRSRRASGDRGSEIPDAGALDPKKMRGSKQGGRIELLGCKDPHTVVIGEGSRRCSACCRPTSSPAADRGHRLVDLGRPRQSWRQGGGQRRASDPEDAEGSGAAGRSMPCRTWPPGDRDPADGTRVIARRFDVRRFPHKNDHRARSRAMDRLVAFPALWCAPGRLAERTLTTCCARLAPTQAARSAAAAADPRDRRRRPAPAPPCCFRFFRALGFAGGSRIGKLPKGRAAENCCGASKGRRGAATAATAR